MQLKEVFQILEKEYPVAISDKFAKELGMQDNSGMLVNFDDEIRAVVFTLDLTNAALEYAIQQRANCIITHHPIIFKAIRHLSMLDNSAILCKAIANKINIISMHLNADAAKRGIDYYVGLGLGAIKEITSQFMLFEDCSYGRIFEVEEQTLGAFVTDVKKNFNSDKIWSFGAEGKQVKRVASFCGAGIDSAAIALMQKHKVDVVVSSDIKHNYLVELRDLDIAVIQMTHYANENYGFFRIYQDIQSQLPCKSSYFIDKNLQ